MYRYLIIIEPGEHNYSAYVPDLPGCVTTGATYEEVQKNMQDALHLRGMIEDQEPIPVPQTTAEYADVPLPGSAA